MTIKANSTPSSGLTLRHATARYATRSPHCLTTPSRCRLVDATNSGMVRNATRSRDTLTRYSTSCATVPCRACKAGMDRRQEISG